MENKSNHKKGFGKRISAIIASILLVFSKGSAQVNGDYLPDSKTPTKQVEMNLDENKNFYDISKHYPDFKSLGNSVISLEDLYSIPVNGEICDTMVPQGLAIKDGMIFITAYDGIYGYKNDLSLYSFNKNYRDKLENEKNHFPHNSVIVVLDLQTKELLATIELPDKNHVGGIAIDDKSVYIAKSNDKNISVISLPKIKYTLNTSLAKNVKSIKINYDYNMDCNCDASFVSIRNTPDGKEQLVVGTWTPFPGASTIRLFDFGNNHNLVLNQKFHTNSSANGATFIKRDGKEYFLVACSLGRKLDSNLFVYEVNKNSDGILTFDQKSQTILPPMVEEIDETTMNGKRQLLINSEAFAKKYEIGRSSVISDGVMVLNLDSLLDKKAKSKKIVKTVLDDVYKHDDIFFDKDERDEDDFER